MEDIRIIEEDGKYYLKSGYCTSQTYPDIKTVETLKGRFAVAIENGVNEHEISAELGINWIY